VKHFKEIAKSNAAKVKLEDTEEDNGQVPYDP